MRSRFGLCVACAATALFVLPARAGLDGSDVKLGGDSPAIVSPSEREIRDPEAQHRRGLMYLNGDGVIRNEKAAFLWIRRAAEQGLAEAQSSLGLLYGKGYGVMQDQQQAVQWLRKAAEQGSAS